MGSEMCIRDSVSGLEHTSGCKGKVEMIVITEDFELVEPWDDIRCQLTGHPTIRPHLVDFFPQDAEFRKFWSRSFFQQEAERLEKAWAQRQANKRASEDTILHCRDEQRKAAAKSKAKGRIPSHKMTTPLKLGAIAT